MFYGRLLLAYIVLSTVTVKLILGMFTGLIMASSYYILCLAECIIVFKRCILTFNPFYIVTR